MSSKAVQLLACIGGIYFCYLLYGVFQETLYRTQADGTIFAATAFVLLVQCFVNAVIALLGDVVGHSALFAAPASSTPARGQQGVISSVLSTLFTRDVIGTSVVYVMAMYLSNEALQYVSYPTQALAKSCKMIPVMLARVLYLRYKYGMLKYACVILMTVGITVFQMSGKKKSSSATAALAGEGYGMFLLFLSLCLDGLAGPLQERLATKHKLTGMQQILVNNVWATVLMLIISVSLGQFGDALAYVRGHPDVAAALFWFSITSAFGQFFIFYTIRSFDSLTLSTITTTRKFFTIVMSVVVHGNSLVNQQWLGVGIVFAGLALEIVEGERSRRAKKKKDHDEPDKSPHDEPSSSKRKGR